MKETDIRPKNIFDEYLRLSAADVETYFRSPQDRIERSCPGCGSSEHDFAFEKNGFGLVQCIDCGTLYVAKAPAPKPLASFYTNSPSQRYWAETFFPSVAETRRRMIFAPRAEKILALTDEFGLDARRIIDVGAGSGIMLEELRCSSPKGTFFAIEPTPELAEECRSRGFIVHEGFVDDAAKKAEIAGTMDLALSFEVIEHVLSPFEFISSMAKLLSPGGYILFTGLCSTGFDIKLLGEHSKAVCPPHHLNFLSRRGVLALTERCGLEHIKFHTPGVLDVDIVKNALKGDPTIVKDSFLRSLLLNTDDEVLSAFQDFLSNNGLSSHMWVVAKKPHGS